ncbi:hypothetical protein ACFE04_007398 [Oxalis oulophora]
MSQEQPQRNIDKQEPVQNDPDSQQQQQQQQQQVAPKDEANLIQKAEKDSEGPTRAAVASENDVVRGLTDSVSGESFRVQYLAASVSKKNVAPLNKDSSTGAGSALPNVGGITIGEALQAVALTAGQKPVEWSDAAAIQAAEVRATGRTTIAPGGVAAAAQSAATRNARATTDEEKTKLGEILVDAASKLPSDRPATRKDAEGVTGAEMRNDPNLSTHPTGVAATVAAAARLNQTNKLNEQ